MVDGGTVVEYNGHTAMVTCLQVTLAARDILFSASRDGTVRVWSIGTARPLTVIRSEQGPIYSILAVGNGSSILSGGSDGSISRFDRESGRLMRVYHGPSTIVFGMAASDDGALVAVGKDRALHYWTSVDPCEFCVLCEGMGKCARHESLECPHEGCHQTFRSKSVLDAHMSDCSHFRQACPSAAQGCPMRQMTKGEYDAHVNICGFRLVACPNRPSCNAQLFVSDLPAHRASNCLFEAIACPNKGCNSMLQRTDLVQHSQQTCVHRMQACRAPGCNIKLSWLAMQVR